jgi:hypothetical protein
MYVLQVEAVAGDVDHVLVDLGGSGQAGGDELIASLLDSGLLRGCRNPVPVIRGPEPAHWPPAGPRPAAHPCVARRRDERFDGA